MPIGLAVIALLLIVTAIRGTTSALGEQLKLDLLGDGAKSGFIVWVIILAILATVGTVGASYGRKDVQNLTQLFMVVLLVALVLKTPDFLQSFVSQVTGGASSSPKVDEGVHAVENEAKAEETKSGASGGKDIIADVAALGTRVGLGYMTGGVSEIAR